MSFIDRFLSKAGYIKTPNGISDNPLLFLSGNAYTQCKDPQTLLNYDTGWVSVCNRKNASTCASLPIKLYYKATEMPKLTPYKKLKSLPKHLDIELKANEEVIEIIEHPLLKLFDNINETLNYFDWCELNFLYLGLLGNSYNEIVYENDIPVALNPLLAEYITPVASGAKQGTISKYIYKVDNVNKEFAPKDILHFANYMPGNTLIGVGELEKCLSAQERYCYYDNFEKALGNNNGRPDMAVGYKGKLLEKDLKDLYKAWNKKFAGVQNSGKVVITDGEYEIKNLNFSPRELQFQVGREWSRQEIIAAYGVPKSLVTSDDINMANSVMGLRQYYKNTIFPKMVKFCSKINEQLTPLFDKNLYVWFSEIEIEDPEVKRKSSIELYNAGIIDKNEARNINGFEAIELEEVEDVKPDTEDIDAVT